MSLDRLKAPLAAFVEAVFPQVDFLAIYAGRVVSQSGPNAFDVQPDDPRLPGMSGIPIKLPFPGFTLQLDPSQSPRCVLGWAGGDPSQPFIALWEQPGASTITIAPGTMLYLGDGNATEPVALGQTLTNYLTALKTFLDALVLPTPAGPAGPPAVPSPSIPTITASKVKAI